MSVIDYDHSINNINIKGKESLLSPEALKALYPVPDEVYRHVYEGREVIKKILLGQDPRFLVIIGPCSIHHREEAFEYAEKLVKLSRRVSDKLYFVMRAYFEKPRTSLGWRGLLLDPDLDGRYDIGKGLKMTREILVRLNRCGLPIASEILDTLIPQYIADLISWASIGARTTESQIHRDLASGLSMPVGFKNSTDGRIDTCLNAVISSKNPKKFIGINQKGESVIFRTKGNPWGHIVLRGSSEGPNYDEGTLHGILDKFEDEKKPPIIIDCSHANSRKKYTEQNQVLKEVVRLKKKGFDSLVGIMLESNLNPGNQPIPEDQSLLLPGVSITDECIGFEESEALVRYMYERL